MCGEFVWKRMVVFGVTFGLGVLVSSAFISKELPAQSINRTAVSAPAENKNCVPVDGSLKYRTLEGKDPASALQLDETPKSEPAKKEAGKKIRQENKKGREAPTEQPLYIPSKDSAEYQMLLHKEQCFEAREQK